MLGDASTPELTNTGHHLEADRLTVGCAEPGHHLTGRMRP